VQSCDTNIFLYYLDSSCPEHAKARDYVENIWRDKNFIISDLVLIELYVLLRNPKVLRGPLSSKEAADCCQRLRANSGWQVLESVSGVMPEIWANYAETIPSAWQIYDLRLGLSLKRAGVKVFATRNTRDFKMVGFEELINPID
jgi:uncharacterized protein